MCQWGLGGRFLLTTWARSSASDAGGVSAKVACLCLPSPDSYYFLEIFIGNWGRESKGGE